MKSFQNKIAVVTGAGSGMGRELARQLAAQGATVAINDWNAETLEETANLIRQAGGRCIASAFSVADKSAVFAFAEQVMAEFGQVDIVINNAGIALEQRLTEKTPYEAFEKIVDINFWGVVHGTMAFLPHLKTRPEAALVNVASIFSIIGYALQGPYVATKFAVRGFSETLRQELAHTGVAISVVMPGAVSTNIIRNIETEKTASRDKLAGKFEKVAKTSSEKAAQIILSGIGRKKKRILVGPETRMIDWMVRLFPSSYEKYVLKKYDPDRI